MVDVFKYNIGNLRVIVVILVLSMGVNFLDVVYVVYVGLLRVLVDYI